MSVRNLNDIVNTNTFGVWIERTNEIIQSLDQVVTMGTDDVANNDGQVYVQGNITTEGSIITDVIAPLDNAADLVDIQAGLTQVELFQLKVPEAGQNNAIQFTYNPDAASADTWRMGPGTDHDSFEIASKNTVTDSEVYDSVISITRATAPAQGETEPTPGIISGTNIEIDSAILPAELATSNANSASRWATARTITFGDTTDPGTGATLATDVTGTMTIDGTTDLTVNLQVVNDSHTHDGRYYTQTYIDTNYATISTSNGTYIKVTPDDADDRSVVTAHGFRMQDDVPITFGNGEDADMQWDGSNFEVRQSSGSGILVAASAYYMKEFAANGNDQNKFKFDLTNGQLTAVGDITAFGSASDITLKENIQPIENALDKVSKIRGVTFNYIDTPDERVPGVIAQELQEVLPEAVYTADDDKLAVRYGNTVALLIEAIKELKAEIETLKAGS